MDSKNSTRNAIQILSSLTVSCHCATVSLPIRLLKDLTDQKFPVEVPLCHCCKCKHSTGLLCTSYMPIAAPPVSTLANTTAYPAETSSCTGIKRYFCSKCGCHVFRSSLPAANPETGGAAQDGQPEVERMWEVATGVLSNLLDVVRISRHENVRDTIDGGLSIFITEQNLHSLPHSFDLPLLEHQHTKTEDGHESTTTVELDPQRDPQPRQKLTDPDVLQAYCACHAVEFYISRPDAASLLPQSPFPDLMIPYYTHDPQIPNPHNEKWWLRSPAGANISASAIVGDKAVGVEAEAGTDRNITPPSNLPALKGVKYLAGTCTCRSCRLTSGFEIQTWAFIPRTNIYFHLPPLQEEKPPSLPSPAISTKTITHLDFPTLRARETKTASPVLKTYESSPGVQREFCGTCGATVFWHDKWRPDIIDVSAGLLDAPEGARAETWLEWWTGRVSFGEEAGRRVERRDEGNRGREWGKEGGEEGWDLIPALERGLGRWGEVRGEGGRRRKMRVERPVVGGGRAPP